MLVTLFFQSDLLLVISSLRLELITASLGLAQFELQNATVLGRRFQLALNLVQF